VIIVFIFSFSGCQTTVVVDNLLPLYLQLLLGLLASMSESVCLCSLHM